MPFEARIRELSEKLTGCGDDAEALQLAQELQTLLHEKIEKLRDTVASVGLITRPQKSAI
jgi:hypothetical protein